MKNPVQGLHHVTVMAASAQRNLDFYSVVLGQRVVKVTVNFDDPGTYHLYYGDQVGSPGTIMTHFPWQGAARGVRGNGEAVATAYSVGAGSLDFWRARLTGHGYSPRQSERFGQAVLSVEDPDGTWTELIADDGQAVPRPWPASPVPAQHALRGFHSVTLWVQSAQPIAELLTGQLGFHTAGQEPDAEGLRWRFRGAGAGVGLYVDAVERPGKPGGRFGAGSIHHVALRTVDDSEQAEYLSALRAAGYGPTPVQDRQYFHSIYFRERGGVLFEIATDAPGFAADESVERLGSHLMLPEWFEGRRAAIAQRVPRIVNHEYGVEIGGGTSGKPVAGAPSPAAESSAPIPTPTPLSGQPRDAQTLRAGRPLPEARVAMILVHGRGGSADDILHLRDAWNQSVYAYLAPQAPSLPGQGHSWYPQSFLAPLEQNQPALDEALSRLERLLAELDAAGTPPERVILGGFSQGACLVAEFVARHPQRYGGVFLYSGALITLQHGGDLAGTPIFMGNSDADPHVPLERFEQSKAALEALGAQVEARVYPGLPHTIVQDELDAVGRMMQALAFESV
ncbi:VOC family protein [Deinococcus sp.]|uniref:VOC family protein n=1 Tax=Deinococcus sp. TaxID=47478 RepID=UPI003CC5BAED